MVGTIWFSLRPESPPGDSAMVERTFVLCGGRGGAACVADGDTVVIGGGESARRIRFSGFDAPELDGECEAERELAREARIELMRWLNERPFYWTGGDDPPRDRYGRELREVWRPGDDGQPDWLAEHMIAEGLARESGWGAPPAQWCDRSG